MKFAIQYHEPDPHQTKEAMLKNRTYQKYRWKDKFILQDYTLEEANIAFANFGNGYRLMNLDTGEEVYRHVG